MKRIELGFTALLLPLDICAVLVSVPLANYWRTTLDILPTEGSRITAVGFSFLLWYLPFLVIFFAYNRLYILREVQQKVQQVFRIISAAASTAMIQFVVILVGRTSFISHWLPSWHNWSNAASILTVIYLWLSIVIIASTIRMFYRAFLISALKRGVGRRQVLIIGTTEVAKNIYHHLKKEVGLGYEVMGVIRTGDQPTHLPIIGDLSEVEQIIQTRQPDEVLQADPDMPSNKVMTVIDAAYEINADFSFAPNLFEVLASNVRINSVGTIPVLELKRTPLDGWGKILKRGIDVGASLLLLVLLSPVFLIAMLLVKLQDGGPIFFGQARVSSGGKQFKMYKFRSMVVNAEKMEDQLRQKYNERADGPLFKMKNDPRVTSLGRFLRKSRIDELPQLYNVLRGDMSLVGPRPHLMKEVAQYQKHQRKVLTIKPGMVGLAQLSGSSDLSFEDEVRLDTYYIENWSLIKDLEILIKTPFIILFKDRSGV